MKNYYSFLLVAFSITLSYSQIVDIPDPAFKTELLSLSNIIDTNGDGEIQVSEAQAVTSLSFSHCNLENVTGIQSFTNLQQLSFSSYCDIETTVDLSGMTSLKSLNFAKCSIPSVNIAGLTGLEDIGYGYVSVELINPEDAVNLKKLMFYSASGFTSVDLSIFPNLVEFSSQSTDLASINVDGLAHLEVFKVTGANELSNLDISDLTSLKEFTLNGGNIPSIDFSNSLLVEKISITGNNLTALDVSMLPNLTSLSCGANELTSLNVSSNTNLEYLSCYDNLLTSIDLSNLHKLNAVDVSDNLFTTLDFSGFTEIGEESPTYDISYNPNLISVNLKNGKEDAVPMHELNCQNLAYLCLDDMDMEGQNYILQQSGITTIQINTYCSFVPGGNYNTITGVFTLDIDNNGCDETDSKLSDRKIMLSSVSGNGITYSDTNGNYNFYTGSGDFLITPQFENPYFTISPSSADVNFADSNNNTQTQSFCITPNGIHNDVEITIFPLQNPRPGFDAVYRLTYRNKGNQMLSGNINLVFDDAVLDFVSANPDTESQSPNQLTWNYGNLLPFEKREIDFTLNVNSPTETPAVNNGDILNFSASITPVENDETIADNTAVFAQTVLGSFDPNDKICLEGNTISPQKVGDYLHYMIRFQNSGTFYAENVVVKDIIDTDKFDIGSLQLTASSHQQVTRISGNKVEFIFENINLPAEQDDEPGSHGFIAFKIKTKNHLTLGDNVENTADIFFDFNFPVVTNTTSTTVAALGVGEVQNNSVAIAPNPVRNILNISAGDNISSIQIFDAQGRLLQTSFEDQTDAVVDFSGKASGIYFVKVVTGKGIKVQKIIRE